MPATAELEDRPLIACDRTPDEQSVDAARRLTQCSLRFFPRQIAFVAAILVAVTPGRAAVFSGPSCVLDCIGDDDCGFNSPKCMCKAAQGNLLNQVLNCMVKHCSPDELANADENFLSAMQILCSGAGHPIPTSDIASAEAAASSLLTQTAVQPPPPAPTGSNHPPPPPPSAPSTGGPAPAPASTSTGSDLADSRPTSTGSGSSPTDSNGATASPSTAKAGVVTTSGTAHATGAGGSSGTVAASQSSTTKDNRFPDPTDSSPFATPVGNSATLPRVAVALAVALPFAALFAL